MVLPPRGWFDDLPWSYHRSLQPVVVALRRESGETCPSWSKHFVPAVVSGSNQVRFRSRASFYSGSRCAPSIDRYWIVCAAWREPRNAVCRSWLWRFIRWTIAEHRLRQQVHPSGIAGNAARWTYIRGIRRMAFNDKTVHTHVYYCLFTITRNLTPKSSTVRHYRNENHSGEGNDDTETKASRIAYNCLVPLWNSIPSYEISIIIFVYIYIYIHIYL